LKVAPDDFNFYLVLIRLPDVKSIMMRAFAQKFFEI
jgi:hypothetical protein